MHLPEGAFPCTACGAPITAWKGDPSTRRYFEADLIDPYMPHRCRMEPVSAPLVDVALAPSRAAAAPPARRRVPSSLVRTVDV